MNIGPQQVALVYAALSIILWLYTLTLASTAILNQWKWNQYRWLFVVALFMLAFSALFAVYFVPLV